MYRNLLILFLLVGIVVGLKGCSPGSDARYYLKTQEIEEGTCTYVIDSKHNTELVCIAEFDQERSINVLPFSRLDIETVSVGPFDGEDITIFFEAEGEKNVQTIMWARKEGLPFVVRNVDTGLDG